MSAPTSGKRAAGGKGAPRAAPEPARSAARDGAGATRRGRRRTAPVDIRRGRTAPIPIRFTAASPTTPAISATSTSGRPSSRTRRTRTSNDCRCRAATSFSTAVSTRSPIANVDVPPGNTPQTTDFSSNTALEPRQAWTLTPDIWVQLLWEKLRVEVEAATIQGQIGYMTGVNQNANNAISIGSTALPHRASIARSRPRRQS